MMTITQTFAGCDVSKDFLDMCWLQEGRTPAHQRFENTDQGRADLIKMCRQEKTACVIYEASGGYERCLRAALHAAGLSGARINARRGRDFARSVGILAKTDQVDAYVLARYGQTLRPESYTPPSPKILELQDFVRRRAQLIAQRKQEKQRLASCTRALLKADLQAAITALTARIKTWEARIEALIESDVSLRERTAIIGSTPGLGPVSIATLLSEIPELGSLPKGRPASLTGTAPHARDSGYMRGRRTCWGGRKTVRDVLYMASLSAIRKVPRWRAAYDRLRAAGKTHKLAAIAIVRRIVETLNIMLKKKTMFKA